MIWGVFQVYIVLPLYILHVFLCFWVVPTKIACEYRFMDVSKLHIFSKTYLHALQYVTAWYYSKYRFMEINLIFKDYESEIYKNDQEVERSSAFWWFDLIEYLMILFRGLFFEIIVNWVFWVFWEPKGQFFSKCLLGVFNYPKKRTKTIQLEVP